MSKIPLTIQSEQIGQPRHYFNVLKFQNGALWQVLSYLVEARGINYKEAYELIKEYDWQLLDAFTKLRYFFSGDIDPKFTSSVAHYTKYLADYCIYTCGGLRVTWYSFNAVPLRLSTNRLYKLHILLSYVEPFLIQLGDKEGVKAYQDNFLSILPKWVLTDEEVQDINLISAKNIPKAKDMLDKVEQLKSIRERIGNGTD